MSERVFEEIELSIDFGRRLMEYKKDILQRMLAVMDDNDKIRQHYQSDKLYICDIIQSLETGEHIHFLYPIKKRLTIVGQMFFKKEFQSLKRLAVPC